MQNINVQNYLHLHFIVFIWGFTAVLGALISIDAIPLVWYRILLAVIFIFLFILLAKISLKTSFRMLIKFIVGGFIIALHWITFFYAIKISNVSITLATMSTGALFVTLLQFLLFRKKIIIYEFIFSIFAILGLILIFNTQPQFTGGILYALMSALLSAAFTILNFDLIKYSSAVKVSFYELLFAVLLITVILGIQGTFNAEFFVLSTKDWMYLLLLSSVCTAYAFVASTSVLRSVSPFTMMLTINLEPIYGIVLALIIFGQKEVMNSNFYIGAALIFFTVILNGILKYKPAWFRIKT